MGKGLQGNQTSTYIKHQFIIVELVNIHHYRSYPFSTDFSESSYI